MNAADYEFRIISSLKRGFRPYQIQQWLGLSAQQYNTFMQVYLRKYRVFSRKGLIRHLGGYL